jgi:hypothetical protein
MGTAVVLWMVFTVAPSGTMTSPASFTVRPLAQSFPDVAACRAHAAKVRLDPKWAKAEAHLRGQGGTVEAQCLPEGTAPRLPEGTRSLLTDEQARRLPPARTMDQRELDEAPEKLETTPRK